MNAIKFEVPGAANPPLQSWSVRLGQLVALIGRPDFNDTVASILHDVVPFDNFTVFEYKSGRKPVPLFHTVTPCRAGHLVHYYASDPFRIDPFCIAALNSRDNGVVSLRTLSPEFERTDYYRFFYRDAGLDDEVGFLVKLNPQHSIVVSLMRDVGGKRFTRQERDQLCWREPLMRELFRQHWAGGPDNEMGETAVVQTAYGAIGHLLSRREFEVVSMILVGYGSEAVAGNLGISLGTVKVHRKNIYRKLKISSQTELFHLCMTPKAHADRR